MLPPNQNPQNNTDWTLTLIMGLQTGVVQVQERLAALSEKQEKALGEMALSLRHLQESFEKWQQRTGAVENRVGDLELRIDEVRKDLDCHTSGHKAEDEVRKADTRQRSFFLFQQKIGAWQAVVLLVLGGLASLIFNLIGGALAKLFGL